MNTGLTWYCSNCDYGVPQAPNSAARALPEECPNCKRVNVMWATKVKPEILTTQPIKEWP